MNEQLRIDALQIGDILRCISDEAAIFLNNIEGMPAAAVPSSIETQELPTIGVGAAGALQLFREKYSGAMSASAGPRYFGLVTGGATPASIAGDWLTSVYDQNATGSLDSAAPQLEMEAIGFLRELFGLPESYSGSFVSGATMSNFVGLAMGRQWVGRKHGVDVAQDGMAAAPTIRVISGTPHSSIHKAMAMLGMGRAQLEQIPTLPDREAVNVSLLRERLRELRQPCIIVGNAGTVNTVDFDDLSGLADLRNEFPVWLHVDAAFGGFASCVPDKAGLVAGIDRADSITIDAHKWLNVPYDCAMQFSRHQDLQAQVFQNSAGYLSQDISPSSFVHLTPENSRRLRAIPVWFTLVAYGRQGYRDIVSRNCAIAERVGELIAASDSFRLLAPVRLNGVLFTLARRGDCSEAITEFLAKVQAGGALYMTPTAYMDKPAVRLSVSNWRTKDSDIDVAWRGMLVACGE